MSHQDRARPAPPVLLERQGRICTLRLNRPHLRNAINNALRDHLIMLLDEIGDDEDVGVIVLAGDGQVFSAGADIQELAVLTPPEAEALAQKARMMHERLTRLSKPVVAAIEGPCIGAGLELALHCDIRFARSDAQFGLPGVTVGLPPGGGAIGRLQRLIGAGPAQALCLTGGIIGAERAFMLGLISNVVAPNEFGTVVGQLAQHLAGLSACALARTKELLNIGLEEGVDAVAARGPEALARCFEQAEVVRRLRSAFGGPESGTTVH